MYLSCCLLRLVPPFLVLFVYCLQNLWLTSSNAPRLGQKWANYRGRVKPGIIQNVQDGRLSSRQCKTIEYIKLERFRSRSVGEGGGRIDQLKRKRPRKLQSHLSDFIWAHKGYCFFSYSPTVTNVEEQKAKTFMFLWILILFLSLNTGVVQRFFMIML